MAENDLDLVRTGLLIENHFGWEAYSDLGTSTTPLELTLADTWYDVPNDAQGPQTDSTYKVLRHTDAYNPITESFDFSDLRIGDLVFIRVSLYFTNNTSNDEIFCRLKAGIGSSSEYTVPLDTTFLKSSNRHHIGFTTFIYIGNEATQKYPAKLQAMSDTTGVDVEVDGWAMAVFTRD